MNKNPSQPEKPTKFEMCFSIDIEKALTELHERFNLDILEYIEEAVRDDLLLSQDNNNDSVLNRLIIESKNEAIAVLKEES